MPPTPLPTPRTSIPLHPLISPAFAPFGTVISNPLPPSETLPHLPFPLLPHTAVPANQGTAIKLPNISPLSHSYPTASPSRAPGAPAISMFICAPRTLLPDPSSSDDGRTNTTAAFIPIPILERHPYTTQTFIPLGLAAGDAADCTRFVVVVAPSVAGTGAAGVRDAPDVRGARAFVGWGDQAVTYAAGTWHAPMVVVGSRAVGFVVVQFVNGEGVVGEDCEEVALVVGGGDEEGDRGAALRVRVELPVGSERIGEREKAKI